MGWTVTYLLWRRATRAACASWAPGRSSAPGGASRRVVEGTVSVGWVGMGPRKRARARASAPEVAVDPPAAEVEVAAEAPAEALPERPAELSDEGAPLHACAHRITW